MQSLTLSQKKSWKTLSLKWSETVLINQIGKVLFSDIFSKKIIKPGRLSVIKLFLVKFPLPPIVIMFYKRFFNLKRLIHQTKDVQRCLTS